MAETRAKDGSARPQQDVPEHAASGTEDAQRIETLEAELAEARKRQLRAQADYENLKRLTARRQATAGRLALTALVVDLLTVLDELDQGLEDAERAGLTAGKWVEGMRLVRRSLARSLERSGLKEILAEGEVFDPHVHEAIAEAAGPTGQVVEVTRPGYMLDEQVLRPTQVIVGSDASDTPPTPVTEDSDQEDEDEGKTNNG